MGGERFRQTAAHYHLAHAGGPGAGVAHGPVARLAFHAFWNLESSIFGGSLYLLAATNREMAGRRLRQSVGFVCWRGG